MNLQAMLSETGNLDLRETTMRLVRGENLSRMEAANFLDGRKRVLDHFLRDHPRVAAQRLLRGEAVLGHDAR